MQSVATVGRWYHLGVIYTWHYWVCKY